MHLSMNLKIQVHYNVAFEAKINCSDKALVMQDNQEEK